MARLERREFIDIQSKKIREIAQALIVAGYISLDDQASALGLPRSTTWTILHAKHKNSGLSAAIIQKILAQPQLSQPVRRKVLEYVQEKASGAYGDNPYRLRRFAARLVGFELLSRDTSAIGALGPRWLGASRKSVGGVAGFSSAIVEICA